MRVEDKELLLKDLCARLPYGIKCLFGVDDAIYEVNGINPTCCGAPEIQATHLKSGINGDFKLNSCKPYLFPMSSMTEEQKKILFEVAGYEKRDEDCGRHTETYYYDIVGHEGKLYPNYDAIDWLNKNHFDYRGLIEKGLAIDATGLNIY